MIEHAKIQKLISALLFAALGISLIAPVWCVEFPPLLDYPNHLARAYALAHLHDPAEKLGEFYASDWGPYPYLASDVLLVGLQKLFSVEVAGKVFLSLVILATPLGAWFFLRAANPGNDALALWAILLSHSIFFLYAFVNFYFSIPVCFLALGLWLRALERPTAMRWIGCLAVFTFLYFCHLVGFWITGMVVIVYLLLKRRNVRDFAASGMLAAPAVAIYWRTMPAAAEQIYRPEFRTWKEKCDAVLTLFASYSDGLALGTAIVVGICFLAAVIFNTERKWNWHWLGVAAVLAALFGALPVGYGDGWDIDIRVLPILFVVLLAGANVGARARKLALVILLLLTVRTAVLTLHFMDMQPVMKGWAGAFDVVPRGSLVFPIVEADEESALFHPYAHFSCYGVVRRGWFTPYLFEMKGLTPLHIVLQTYTHDGYWDKSYDTPPEWAQVRRDYDYVWAFNVDKFTPQLEEIGELVYASGQLEVYRVKKTVP